MARLKVRVYGLRRTRHANCAAPLVEHVEDVGITEFDADRTASRPLGVVALEIAIDAPIRHLQRHTLGGPTADLTERRTDAPDKVTIVLATEVGLDLATVL